MKILRGLKVSGDLGHEMFENMRKGDWYIEYMINRLKEGGLEKELKKVAEFLKEALKYLKKLPMSLRPKYGSRVIEKLYNAAIYEIT